VFMLFPLFPDGTAWDVCERYFYPQGDGARGEPPSPPPGAYPLTEHVAFGIILGAAKALVFMHERGFAHRDMKPHNILLRPTPSGGYEAVVMDFGSTAAATVHVTSRKDAFRIEEEASQKSSAAYRPPELTQVASGGSVTAAVDIWALGCTLYCLAFGHSPFENDVEGVLRLAILNGKWPYPASMTNRVGTTYSEGLFRALVDDMLEADPAGRPPAVAIVERIQTALL
jgi:serine/threonine kinase 16